MPTIEKELQTAAEITTVSTHELALCSGIILFPLNRAGGFACYVVDDAVDAFYLVDNPG